MSSAAATTQVTPPDAVAVYNVPRPRLTKEDDHVAVYGHSSLLYWWPVWLVCFVLAAVTYAENDRSGGVTVSNANGPGMVFVITLLIVAISSTVVFWGLVSVIVAVLLLTMAVTFAWFGWWGEVLRLMGGMEIRINAAGYLCIGIPLFVALLAVVLVYDRQHYVVFGLGQIRYVVEVGESEVAAPAGGAVVEKRRSDAFRHWVLGLGAGDLVIRVGSRSGLAVELKNVLNIRRELVMIDRLLRGKAVTVG